MVRRLAFIFLSTRDMRASFVVVAVRSYRRMINLSTRDKNPIAHLTNVKGFVFSSQTNQNAQKPSLIRCLANAFQLRSVQYVLKLRQDFLERDPTHPQRLRDKRKGLFLSLAAALCFFIWPALRAQ